MATAPPAIVFAPTSDSESDADTPFRLELDHDDHDHDGHDHHTAHHPHEAALLRRSPSPSPSLRRSPSPSHRFSSSFPTVGSIRPGSAGIGFLRPPSAGIMAADGTDTAATVAAAATPADSSIATSPAGNPFNFQTQYISTSPVKSNMGLRRGHRYKHSSVSAQHHIFQEPPRRPPPVLPASLPLPTLREAWASMQRDQRARLYWCLCHAAVALFVFLCGTLADGGDSLALTALSHLVFFDVGSAAVCVAVDVLGNFEVWRRSTIRHPFGLRRAEVLAAFAMSIFLVFGGFDLLSHDLKDWFEAAAAAAQGLPLQAADHHAVHYHHDGRSHHARHVRPGSVDVPALAAFASTLVSAYGLGNQARIRRALLLQYGVSWERSSTAATRSARAQRPRAPTLVALAPNSATAETPAATTTTTTAHGVRPPPPVPAPSLLARLPGLPAALANPFHFLTLGVSLVLLVLPLLFITVQPWLDRLLCATIALSMLLLGARLAVAQGLMLLMSFAGRPPSVDPAATTSAASSSSSAAATASSAAGPSSARSVAAVLDDIAAEPSIARVEDAQFWQVHYGLCMANLRLRVVRGCDDGALRQLRARVARVIQNRLGEGYGRGNSLRWEVTVQTSVEGG